MAGERRTLIARSLASEPDFKARPTAAPIGLTFLSDLFVRPCGQTLGGRIQPEFGCGKSNKSHIGLTFLSDLVVRPRARVWPPVGSQA